jgi:hypothetical protein
MSFFDVKLPSFGEVKDQRGLAVGASSIAGPYLVDVPIDFFRDYHAVQPGKEITFAVAVDALPPNANMTKVVVTLHAADADGAPDQNNTGVSITKNGKPNDPASGSFQVAVNQPVRPSNVQLKLAGGDPIWTFGGVLTAMTYNLPDFARQLNAYLDKAQAAAKSATPLTSLSFVCKSDTAGKVGLAITHLEYSQVKTQAWPNPLDHTTRVDRNLSLAFGTVERLPLDALTDQNDRPVELLSLKLDLSGQFGPDRLLGDVATHDGHQFATISSDYSVAQSFTLSGDLIKGPRRCTGITCFFTADDKAELYVELQPDANGYPGADAPLAKANLSFAPPDKKDATQPWTFAKLVAPVELKTGLVYWVVVKGVRGSARLGLQAAPGSPPGSDARPQPVVWRKAYVNRGGMIWKSLFHVDPIPSIIALLGVVYLPGKDDQTAAVEIAVTGLPTAGVPLQRTVDPGRAPQTIALDPQSSNWNTSLLELRSHAEGTLTIANVIREYRLKQS